MNFLSVAYLVTSVAVVAGAIAGAFAHCSKFMQTGMLDIPPPSFFNRDFASVCVYALVALALAFSAGMLWS